MKKLSHAVSAFFILCLLSSITIARAQPNTPLVRAVLFYSPTCGHCEYVINETLLPMIDHYGDQLQIIALDVTQQQGQAYFRSAMQKFALEQAGVPFLVIGDTYLIGSSDIPSKFPGLVEAYIAHGGIDWPDIPGLLEALESAQNTPEPSPTLVPVVRTVLFYRSTCRHCQELVAEAIPPLVEEYGPQLEIFGIDVSKPEGEALYESAIELFKIERIGVPTLILGDQVLVGGVEIEERFAGITKEYLLQGGVDWPDMAGLREAISQASKGATSTAASSTQTAMLQGIPSPIATSLSVVPSTSVPSILGVEGEPSSWLNRFGLDPAGNGLSVIVLLGMLGSVVWVVTFFKKGNNTGQPGIRIWIIPILCVIGFGVAGYLAYVESTQATAICGPVGDCNTVQQSEYARLFGIFPMGVLGLIGYASILTAWLIARLAPEHFASLAVISMFVMTAFGTLFSIYLTFLEPFVIGATCAWCLTSAVLMTVLMLLSARPAKGVFFSKPTSMHPR